MIFRRQDALIWNLRAGGWPFSLVIQVPEEPGGKGGGPTVFSVKQKGVKLFFLPMHTYTMYIYRCGYFEQTCTHFYVQYLIYKYTPGSHDVDMVYDSMGL